MVKRYTRKRPALRRNRRRFKGRRINRKRAQARAKFNGTAMRSTVMPLKFNFTSRYVDMYKTVTSNVGVANSYAWWANGLYDPQYLTGGHQVIGFDQLMGFYDHYTVVGAKIRVDIQNQSQQHDVVVGIFLSDSPTLQFTAVQTIVENGAIVWKRLERQGTDSTFITNSGSHCTLTKKCSVKKFLGRPNILSEDDLRGDINNNPNEGVFFHVLCAGIDASADAVTISFSTQIDYVAILTEPKHIIGS